MLGLLAQASSDYTYTTVTTTKTDTGLAAGVAAFFAAYFIVILIVAAIMVVSLWKLFVKAGKPGWAAIVPIYNVMVYAEVAGKPGWWGLGVFLSFVPFVGWIAALAVQIYLSIEFAKAFGKEPIWAALLILLPIIGYPILAFSKDTKYTLGGSKPSGTKPAAPTPPAAA